MARRIPMIDGNEYDALTRWRKFLKWKAGERQSIKRKYRRRERRLGKQVEKVTGEEA